MIQLASFIDNLKENEEVWNKFKIFTGYANLEYENIFKFLKIFLELNNYQIINSFNQGGKIEYIVFYKGRKINDKIKNKYVNEYWNVIFHYFNKL